MGFWFARNCKSLSHIFLDDAREVGLSVVHAMFHVFPSDSLYFWAIYLFPDGNDASIRTLHSRIGVGDMYTLFRTVYLACCYYMAIVDYVR